MIFSVTTDQFNLGTVFLIWSIHYITGKKEFYQKKTDTKEIIPENPLLNGITAHKMRPNFCRSFESFKKVINKISSDEGLNHVKFTPKADTLEKYHNTNKEFHEISKKHGVKVINMTCRKFQHLVGFLRYDREEPNWQNNIDTVKEHCKHYWPHFFEKAEIFPNRLNTWHDIREGIAFNIRPNDFWTHMHERNTDKIIYHCQAEDLLKGGTKEILNILKFLNCEFDQDKLNSWCAIHKTRSNNLKHYINFCNDINTIVENIISNKYIDLEKYKMDVLKEGVILHFLMYKHDLNLNTTIEKLPSDTRKIFSLLEQNRRTGIEKLYDRK